MKSILLAAVLVFVVAVPCAQGTSDGVTQAKQDDCFSPLEWAGQEEAGLRACKKTSGCEPCARESGAALGLCHAYCEAMECDTETPAAPEAVCLKVEAKYIQATGNAALPCDEGLGTPSHCGSFAACIDCLYACLECLPIGYYEEYCEDCAEDLESLGCINICSP